MEKYNVSKYINTYMRALDGVVLRVVLDLMLDEYSIIRGRFVSMSLDRFISSE